MMRYHTEEKMLFLFFCSICCDANIFKKQICYQKDKPQRVFNNEAAVLTQLALEKQ